MNDLYQRALYDEIKLQRDKFFKDDKKSQNNIDQISNSDRNLYLSTYEKKNIS